MKYCVLIIDGAADLPLPERGGSTCLELAYTPNLDAIAKEGTVGLASTIPDGMEASSACACMAVLGYDPRTYYRGRAGIEARSMGIPVEKGEVVFRCNLVAVQDGKMLDYSAGHISTAEAQQLVAALNEALGNEHVRFYPGVSYRHILKLKGREDTLLATCIPPHDISGRPVNRFMPSGPGSDVLLELMTRSEAVLRDHAVNIARWSRGDIAATTIWLFWGSGQIPDMPSFKQVYGLDAVITSGVDLLRGLARMVGMGVMDIAGVTDDMGNDYVAQVVGALLALEKHDMVVIHVEAPDEAAHSGFIDDKIDAIQKVDGDIVSRLRSWGESGLRVLIMPDHPTPVKVRTHIAAPVPFVLWGAGFTANGAQRFTESEAAKTTLFIDPGYNIMSKLVST